MYKVVAALQMDINQGWVWLTGSGFDQRSIVKITNKANNKSVYCERLEIDENFIKEYNKSSRVNIDPKEETAVINAWYRKKLGDITTKASHDLLIVEANGWCGKLKANISHPQVVVRLATWLAFISVGLGIIGIGLGWISICMANK